MVWSKCLNHMGRKRLPSTAPMQMNVRKQNSLEFGEILSLFWLFPYFIVFLTAKFSLPL